MFGIVEEKPVYLLYGGDYTRAPLVQWVLEEGGIPFEFRKIDIVKGEHKAPEFLAINPAGLIPVLITPEGDALFEMAALMVYLADRHRLSALAPSVDDPLRGLFLSTVFFIADLQPEIKRFHFPHRFALRTEDVLSVRDNAKTIVLDRLGIVNTRLTNGGPYLLGPRFSLADFHLCFWVALVDRNSARAKYPAVATLYDLVRSRPGVTRHLADAEAMADEYNELVRKNPTGVVT